MDATNIQKMDEIIRKYANITTESSSHIYFNTQPVDSSEITHDLIFFQIEGEDENIIDEKLNELIGDIDGLKIDYSLRDEDTGDMIVYVKFVAALDIKFDKLKIIKKGTYKKIDELKSYKSDLGTCKGYRPYIRPLESKPLEIRNINPESIYLFCHSQEDLMKLKDELSEKIMEIDSDFEIGFRQFMGEKPEYKTMQEQTKQ